MDNLHNFEGQGAMFLQVQNTTMAGQWVDNSFIKGGYSQDNDIRENNGTVIGCGVAKDIMELLLETKTHSLLGQKWKD